MSGCVLENWGGTWLAHWLPVLEQEEKCQGGCSGAGGRGRSERSRTLPCCEGMQRVGSSQRAISSCFLLFMALQALLESKRDSVVLGASG